MKILLPLLWLVSVSAVYGITSSEEERITGGTDVLPGEYPYFVSVREKPDNPLDHYCGGTILSEDWVLTAGWCCTDPERFYVLVSGITDLANGNRTTEQHVEAANFTIHPEWNSLLPNYHNLCLIKVSLRTHFKAILFPTVHRQLRSSNLTNTRVRPH